MKTNVIPIQEKPKTYTNFSKTDMKFDVKKIQQAMNDVLGKMMWKEWHV